MWRREYDVVLMLLSKKQNVLVLGKHIISNNKLLTAKISFFLMQFIHPSLFCGALEWSVAIETHDWNDTQVFKRDRVVKTSVDRMYFHISDVTIATSGHRDS